MTRSWARSLTPSRPGASPTKYTAKHSSAEYSTTEDSRVEAGDADAALRAAARGDQEAFAVFYDATAGLVHAAVLQTLPDPAPAEDVTHDTFVEAWRLAAHWQTGQLSAKEWVVMIAYLKAQQRAQS